MMSKTMICALGALGAIMSANPASAQDFDGSTIAYQLFFPDLGTPLADPLVAVVGPGVEFPSDQLGYYGVDLGGSDITVTDLFGGSNAPGAFNGFVLSDFGGTLAEIVGVTFTGGGLAGEMPIVTFDADNIYFNFVNIPQATAQGTQYFYTVDFAAVPEPASWAMMIGGFGLVGGAARARRRTTAFA